MSNRKAALLVLAMAWPLGACGKVWYESGTALTGTSTPLLTTAGVRTVYRAEIVEIDEQTGRVRPKSILCAEPSPDVAIALGAGNGAGVSGSGLGALLAPEAAAAGAAAGQQAPDITLAVSLASSRAEAVGQLAERLATIQLLRDGLYRACEAYANGAITPTIYTLMASRMDELLTTLLATEIAGGAFGRSGAGLSTTASGSASASQTIGDLVEKVEEAQKKTEEAGKATATATAASQTASATQQKAADARVMAATAAPAAAPAAADSAATATVAAQKAQQEAAAANQTAAQKQGEATQAQEQATKAAQNVKLAQATQAQTSAAGTGIGIGGLTVTPSAHIAEQIHQIQLSYMNDTNADAAIVACLAELGNTPVMTAGTVKRRATKLADICETRFGNMKDFVVAEVSLKRQQQIGDLAKEACMQAPGERKGQCVAEIMGAGRQLRLTDLVATAAEESCAGDPRRGDCIARIIKTANP
jgi:hypothetical protein